MESKIKPMYGIAVFIALMASVFFIGAPIQREWGMYGVVVTEIIILLFALIPVMINKINVKKVFPLKKPAVRQIAGVLILWGASYLAVIEMTLILTYLFPQGMTDVSTGLNNVFTSVPMAIAFVIIAIIPAICEEVFHRGFLLFSLRSINNKWQKIALMAIIFGIFHLDIYRFIPTAILGFMMTFIMVETDNLFLPALFHFVNNALTTVMSFQSQNAVSLSSVNQKAMILAIASFLIISALVPFLLVTGTRLLHPKINKSQLEISQIKKKKQIYLVASICSFILFLTGSIMIVLNLNVKSVFETAITMEVAIDNENLSFPMQVDRNGQYSMELNVKISRGIIDFKILDESKKTIYQMSCGELTSTGFIDLKAGTYLIVIDFMTELNEVEDYYQKNNIILSDDLKKTLLLDEVNLSSVDFEFRIAIR